VEGDRGRQDNPVREDQSRTGADKGYVMVVPEDGCSTMNADGQRAGEQPVAV
jgi:gluconolactonase